MVVRIQISNLNFIIPTESTCRFAELILTLTIVSHYMVFRKSDAITGLVEFPYCNLDRMDVLIFIRMFQHFHCSHTPSIAPSYWTIDAAKTPDLARLNDPK